MGWSNQSNRVCWKSFPNELGAYCQEASITSGIREPEPETCALAVATARRNRFGLGNCFRWIPASVRVDLESLPIQLHRYQVWHPRNWFEGAAELQMLHSMGAAEAKDPRNSATITASQFCFLNISFQTLRIYTIYCFKFIDVFTLNWSLWWRDQGVCWTGELGHSCTLGSRLAAALAVQLGGRSGVVPFLTRRILCTSWSYLS